MLINEILDLSRIEAGRFDLKEEGVALAHIVEEGRRLLGLRAKKRHITIEKAVELDLPKILADARAVRQVVLSLLSNAIKFTPEGGLIKSNYPPAEPGALFSVSRSKRLEGDADASPAHCAT